MKRYAGVVAVVLTAVMVGSLLAQAPAREVAIDVRPVAGVLSVAWRVADRTMFGIALGGGIDELDATLEPDTNTGLFHDMEQIVHIGTFLRFKPSPRLDIDLGGRLGYGGVRACDASDCWPDPYAGLYVGAFYGGRRFKIGPRIHGAVAWNDRHKDSVVHVEILTGRIALGW